MPKSEESRARIAVDQEIEATRSLTDLVNPNQLREQIMAAELKWCYDIVFLIYQITERTDRDKTKGRKTLTPSGRLKKVFSGRQLGLVREETRVVFYTRTPRETVRTTWDEVKKRKKFSPRASVLFSTECEETY